MTKRTPLQRLRALEDKLLAAREAFETWKSDESERSKINAEQIRRVLTDPTLSPKERLDILKGCRDAWPRIVLGVYEAELEIAQQERKQNGDTEYNGEPSDIAYSRVGEAVDLGPDRIRDLCREGRRHLEQGMSEKMKVKISAAEFDEKVLRMNAPRRRNCLR